MYRRYFVGMIGALTIVAVTALAAGSAFAEDPQEENCIGLGAGVKNIDLGVEPNTAGSASSFSGGVLLCGSDLGDDPKGFKSGAIKMPWAKKGDLNKDASAPKFVQLVNTRCANPEHYNTEGGSGKADCPAGTGPHSLEEGQYTGSVGMGIATQGNEISLDGSLSKIYVQKAPGTPEGNTHCTAAAIACYQGTDGVLGYADITVVKTPKIPGKTVLDTYTLNIHEIVLMVPLPLEVYYTRIGYPEDGKPLNLCAYAGAVNAVSCGSSSSGDWVQKNGPAAKAKCNALDWALMGWMNETYDGVGFLVSTENNVSGADEWWGSNPDDYGPGWTENEELIAAAQQHKFDIPYCSDLTIVDGGAGKPGAGENGDGDNDAGRGGSDNDAADSDSAGDADSARDASRGNSDKKRDSRHRKTEHRPFR